MYYFDSSLFGIFGMLGSTRIAAWTSKHIRTSYSFMYSKLFYSDWCFAEDENKFGTLSNC